MTNVLQQLNHSSADLIARALYRAWSTNPDHISVSSQEISSIVPLLLANGSAALVWRRLQLIGPPTNQLLIELQDSYRHYSIMAAVHEHNVRDIFKRARAVAIEPILFKGWSLARLYPDDGLRPYGDIDLWVCAKDLLKLKSALLAGGDQSYYVEPHCGFYPQYERSFDQVFSRSKLIPLDDIQVRVPCDEDHLRFICLHFLFHGGWRPLWLCDIGLMVEAAGTDFDWDRCLCGKRKHSDWIACTIGLAHQLLGANVRQTPVERRAQALPQWLKTAVLRQWEKGAGMSGASMLSFSVGRRLREPTAIMRAMKEHWRNPIQASVEMDAWFSEKPRSMVQIESAFRRLPQFAEGLIAQMSKGSPGVAKVKES